MRPEICTQLLELNARFYRSFADPFSATRQHPQPGAARLAAWLLSEASQALAQRLLDLGCGNGTLARYLQEKGFQGMYCGLDASEGLLETAKKKVSADNFSFLFADLSSPAWDAALPPGPFDAVFAFAVLHHLPAKELRLRLLRQVRSHLALGSYFIHSEWQFQNSPRLAGHIHSWELLGLLASDLEPGDALLDWRAGGEGLRYIHLFSETELNVLARESGFRVSQTFYSDGKEGNLGLYQVWIAV